MFQRGGTTLSDFAKKQFQKIASVVDMCPTHKLKIEGYTDSMPYSGGALGYGNWELSGERANAARRELVAQKVSIDRIAQVIGYGDSVPTLPDDPTNAINRRISITILPPLKVKRDLMMNDKQ
jgi:chemotaxis protein MotB